MKGIDTHVLVSILATVSASGKKPERQITLEARMPMSDVLNSRTLNEAVECFQIHCDQKENILEVHSFKASGREMIGTFLGGPSAEAAV